MDRILDDADTTSQHMSHYYDRNCSICKGNMDKTAQEKLDKIEKQLAEKKRRVAELERLKRQAEEAAYTGSGSTSYRPPPPTGSSSSRDSRPPPEPTSRSAPVPVQPVNLGSLLSILKLPFQIRTGGFARTGAQAWTRTAAPVAPAVDDDGGDSPGYGGGGFDDDDGPDTSVLNYSK